MEKLVAFGKLLVVVLFVGVVLVGCTPPAAKPAPQAPTPAPAKAPRVLELAISPQSITEVEFALIKEREIDRKYGLDMQKINMPIGEIHTVVFQARLPIATTGTGTLANYFIKGEDIKALTTNSGPLSALVTWKGSGVKTIQQAKGKKIIVPSRPTGGYWEQAVIFKLEGFDIEKDFQMIESADLPLIAGVLERKEVALAQTWESLTSKLLIRDVVENIWYFRDKERELFGRPIAISGYAARGEWVRANPDVAKAFIKIDREVKTLLIQNPGLVDAKAGLMGLTDPREIELQKKVQVNEEVRLRGYDPTLRSVLDKWLKTAYELGLLGKLVKANDIIFDIPE